METTRKDDPPPLVVGRISKKSAASLSKVMDGIGREAVADFKARLTVAAAERMDVGLSRTLGELIKAAEESK